MTDEKNTASDTPAENDSTENDSTENDSTENDSTAAEKSAAEKGADEKSGDGSAPRGKKRAASTSLTKSTSQPDSGPSSRNGPASQKGPSSRKGPAAGKKSDGFSFTVTGRGLLTALAGLVVVALVVGCAVLGWIAYQQAQREEAFTDSKNASENFVTKLVSTLNAGNADQYKEIIGPLSTGDLRKRLEQERTDTEKSVKDLNLEATSKITSTSVESVDTESASTVVMAEVTGRSTTAPNGATNLMVFLIDLQKVDGQWLVSEFSGPPGTEASGVVDPSQSLPGSGSGEGSGETQTPATQAPAESAPAPAPGG